MTDSKFIDSSVWIEYLTNGSFKEIFESNDILLLSVLSLFEIKKVLVKQKINYDKILKSLYFIKDKSLFINVDANIAESAAELSDKYKLPSIDALIYASALKNNAILITMDNDFRKLDNVTLIS